MDNFESAEGALHELSKPGTVLLVLMSNPPLNTTGDRTRRRVELVRELLEVEETMTANLFSIPTYRTGGIAEAGKEPQGWLDARPVLGDAIEKANAVLLAYGGQEPTGPARSNFRDQVAWMRAAIDARGASVWTIGGRPLHPTRWHRHTHAQYPGIPFREALVLAVQAVRRSGPTRPE